MTSAKLGYDPLELDPELMTPLAGSDPQTLANYSVSDAVATYYLYMKYVHPFIFSLCNIIPLNPDDVLRKGSGTLCETLLMAEAYRANVIMPNKHTDGKERFYAGHLIESETYIGGHVEALEAGVFRSDIEYKFRLDPAALQQLINDLDRALTFSLKAEGGVDDLGQVTNYEEVKADIQRRLEMLRDTPNRSDRPLIYHLDVAAMYPNIILTNRLQPTAMIEESDCAMCDHNRPGKTCQRTMTWNWRGELYTAKKNEYRMIKSQLESEQFPLKREGPGGTGTAPKPVPYHALPETEQNALLQKRLSEYSQKVYRRVRKTEVVKRESIVCQKEHAFYIDTVRSFRDRRYDYKGLHKKAKKMVDDAQAANDAVKLEECKKLVVLYDSLQLAHKCILNSFYGYVMRKGARWYSMEMAGIVCATGSSIIQLARQLVERVGRPLELDTDGIWCMLPWDFPQGYAFKLANGKSHAFDYPCVMLNHLVHDKFTNDQYHTLTDPTKQTYAQSSENSIFFEIDGPYRAMIIPSSTEEGKLLKKRYAVFNENGSLAELKGFEVKRRGELKCLKVFQTQIFKVYLQGSTLAECYAKVAEVADYWLDILHGKGQALEDHDLVDLISENRSMSKSLEEYGEQKSTSISTAKRLAEFLGEGMVKDRGLACKFIISAKPAGIPVASRAIPLAIFSAEEPIKRHYLRRWLKDPSLQDFDMRSIIDWDYYLERLGSMIQKLIVIPAALQAVPNPVGRVSPPDWLLRKSGMRNSGLEGVGAAGMELNAPKLQTRITESFFKVVVKDVEDIISKPVATRTLQPEPNESNNILDKEGEEVEAELPPVSMMNKDYAGWIGGMKAHWRALRQRLADPIIAVPRTKSSTSAFGRLAEHDKELISRAPWQIVQVDPVPDKPGQFRVWAVITGSPHVRSFKLVCPRTIYLQLSCPLEDVIKAEGHAELGSLLRRAYRKLPDGRDAEFLYEFQLPEAVFQRHFYQFASITSLPQLVAVFEDGIPLDFLLTYRLGACAMLNGHVRRLRDAQSQFSPDDFNFCSTAEVPYLASTGIQYVSILHMNSDSRHLILLGHVSGELTKYRLLIVENGMRRQLPGNLKALLPEATKEDQEKFFHWNCSPGGKCMIEADMFADLAGAQRAIQRTLQELIDSRVGPVIALHHQGSSRGTGLALGLDIPVIKVPTLTGEAAQAFPALDWQRIVSRRLFGMQASLDAWLEHRLSLARYAHIPLGNFLEGSDDAYAQVTDVFFARALVKSGHLLWWRNESSCSASAAPTSSSSALDAYETVEAAPSISAPSFYRTVCVEADLTGLAINAIMEHASIAAEELSGSSLLTVDQGSLHLQQAAGQQISRSDSSALLAILKRLLTAWLRDHVHTGQIHAQQLALGLHTWVMTGSRLHSAQLSRRLASLINRTLTLLAVRLHSYGCLVVHIDAGRVVLRTAREDLAATHALIDWIGRELKKQEAFGWLDFIPVRYWRCLMWMDSANFHGIAYASADLEDDREDAQEPVLQWSIVEYLPPALQPIFKRLIQEYIHRTLLDRPVLQDAKETDDEDDDQEDESIGSDFAQLFLRVIREAQKFFYSPVAASQEELRSKLFPALLGSRLASIHGTTHVEPRAALLEFVKVCGAAFRLDSDHPRRADRLLKLAYSLLGIREFSDETEWKMPMASLHLPGLICRSCTRSTDLDLCLAVGQGRMACEACDTSYDLSLIESALIGQLSALLVDYQIQDLACTACGPASANIKADMMQSCCTRCSKPFQLATMDPVDIKEHVHITRQLSESLSMASLSAFIDSLPIF